MSSDLTRRAFLGDAALVGTGSLIGLDNAFAREAPGDVNPSFERRSSFDDGWSFSKGDVLNGESGLDTGGNWAPVDLPHDWSKMCIRDSRTAPKSMFGRTMSEGY